MPPVHYFYGGAHLFRPGLAAKLGALALQALPQFLAAQPQTNHLPLHLEQALRAKLQNQPVEAYRIDFEDGYGPRPTAEMDGHARQAAKTLQEDPTLPASLGLRIPRGNPRPLQVFLDTLGSFPAGFVVVLPKVETVDEVLSLLATLPATAQCEVLVETPAMLTALPELLRAAGPRIAGLHLGPYDWQSSLGIPAPFQQLHHPACAYARLQMRLAVAAMANAGATIEIVDGPTKLLPLGDQAAAGWQQHRQDILLSLAEGVVASWELHPLQLLSRYATLLHYYDTHLPTMRERLQQAESTGLQATRTGAQFDDASTVRGLRAFLDAAARFGL